MADTCSNPLFSAVNDGLGFAEKARLFILGSLASTFTKAGEWVRWLFVIYMVLAGCLFAILILHSLIHYGLSIWDITVTQAIRFRQHTTMRMVWALVCFIGSLLSALVMAVLWPLWVPFAMIGILIHTAIFAYNATVFVYKVITFSTNVAITFATKIIVWIIQHAWKTPWSLGIWLSHQAWLGGRWGFQLIWKPPPAPPKKHLPPTKTYADTLKKLNDFYDAEEDGTLKKHNDHYDDEDFFEPETPYNPADFVDADNRAYDISSSTTTTNIPVVPPYSSPEGKQKNNTNNNKNDSLYLYSLSLSLTQSFTTPFLWS